VLKQHRNKISFFLCFYKSSAGYGVEDPESNIVHIKPDYVHLSACFIIENYGPIINQRKVYEKESNPFSDSCDTGLRCFVLS